MTVAFFGLFPSRAKTPGREDWHGLEFSIDDRRIPEAIRARLLADYRQGFQIFYTNTQDGGEWWLLSGDELIEAYWEE